MARISSAQFGLNAPHIIWLFRGFLKSCIIFDGWLRLVKVVTDDDVTLHNLCVVGGRGLILPVTRYPPYTRPYPLPAVPVPEPGYGSGTRVRVKNGPGSYFWTKTRPYPYPFYPYPTKPVPDLTRTRPNPYPFYPYPT